MKYDVTLKEIPAMQVMSLRDTMPSYDREGDLWQRLYGETAGHHAVQLIQADNSGNIAIGRPAVGRIHLFLFPSAHKD